jgi:GNAT superfamily N-acetyltransferase
MSNHNTRHPDDIVVPDAPSIPGLAFRYFRDESDYAIMAEVFNAVSAADQLFMTSTAATMANWWALRADFDPHVDIFFAEVGGVVIAFGHSWHTQEGDGTRLYWPQGRVLPAWRRRGLGRAMLHYNESRLRAVAATHPDDGPRVFISYALDTAIGTNAQLISAGYAPARHFFHMVRDLSDDISLFPLPPGLEVRPAQPEHFRQIWEAEQEALQDHWGYTPATEDDFRTVLNDPNFDPSLWRIAWDGDQVAGQVRSFIDAGDNEKRQLLRGYTEYISVRRPWRKRGLARALISLSLQAVKARGMTEAALRVDSENLSGALRVYESCGFRVEQRSTEYRKPMQ